jgi:hypothetical protein
MSPTPPELNTPVLFLVFNRPETTAQVFEAIRKAQPPRLYVAADGPRLDRVGEAEKVAKVREIATAVDWPCEVKTLFREENLGCKKAVSGAITWFFEHEEQGIILEDDCLPHPDFFNFCDSLLERYRGDNKVWVITGNNFQNGQKRGEASYYFSHYNHCWGWATWRRAWKHYQGDLPFWPGWKASQTWTQKLPDRVERRYWSKIFDRVYKNQIDSWAYPWAACVWYHGGLAATPNVNLVSNIGFGSEATHTTSKRSSLAEIKTESIGKLCHPSLIEQDLDADKYVFNYTFGGKSLRFPQLFLRLPWRVLSSLYQPFKKVLHRAAQ